MLNSIIDKIFFGNSVAQYLIAVATFFALNLAIKIFKRICLKHLNLWAKKTSTSIDDFIVSLIEKIALPASYFGAFYLAVNVLNLNSFFNKIIDVVGIAVITLFSARFLTVFLGYTFDFYLSKRKDNESLERSLSVLLKVSKGLVWGLAVFWFLDNLGFKISAVIAGLGIGGLAVGLAAQAILKDLFSYFSILFDCPFEIGDFIIVGEYLGCVEYIGAKTTRIRSLSGEQLIFSNTDLTDSRVRNYKRMEKRRVLFSLGVTYGTRLEILKEIPKIIEKIIKNVKDTAFDRAHFFKYADFSLNFEIVYYIIGSDYNKYMDIQQEINFAIKDEFEKRNIEFAFPTQTLYLNKNS